MKDLLATVACFFALAAFWLGCPQPSAAQSPAAPLKIAPVLSKPLEEVEKLLGKPRHIGEEQERYYKAAGFVRVVVRPMPQKTLASITLQFAPGTIKNERAALARIGIVDSVLPDHWTVRWVAPGDSKNDELILARVQEEATQNVSGTQNIILTRHFLERMQERGVSEAQARELLESGKRFYDPKNDSYIRYKDGIYIALTKDGTLKTVIRGPISKRWQPL
ncbi:DUF4258 domain-containing protein [Armatimonas sp.]|uniref:DUF4258 domain-containing protein n=1 Tax=Armatimonas sp. TaxID=1872638 RepID=UPI0037501F79